MSYILKITKEVENPKYDAEIAKNYRGGMAYRNDFDPSVLEQLIIKNVLDVELDDEEYRAIKKAVIAIK